MNKSRKSATVGNRLAPPRFLLFVGVLAAGYLAMRWAFPGSNWRDAAAMAFDAGALVFLVSIAPLVRDSAASAIRAHAAQNDANRLLILVMTTMLTFIAMAALTGEIEGARRGEALPLIKLVGTLLAIWLFANTVYAMHYAHAFYSQSEREGGDAGGLSFPGTKAPTYSDFLYFAFTLGMTFQTSDVEITSRPIRLISLFHCLAAFVFNIGVIAFTINVLGGAKG